MPFYTLEVDDGKVQKTGRMAALVTHVDQETRNPQRHLVSAHPVAGTTAVEESAAILKVVKDQDWELAQLLWVTSDSAGTMEKARSLTQKAKGLRISELIAQGISL